MRCPKCQYISFDSGDRCRNCGYEFSLAADAAPVDVTIGRDEPPPGRIRDLSLTALDTPLSPSGTPSDAAADESGGTFGGSRRPVTAEDLPLFIDRVADDQAPLVTPPAVPRPPLSVRRTNPATRERLRSARPEELSLELAREWDGSEIRIGVDDGASGEWSDAAGILRRVAAGLIDVTILAAILAGVVYLTLRVCELTIEQWRALPLGPLVAFLLLLCGGYFVLFTAAGGQTIGKMAARIRVVSASETVDGHVRVSFAAAMKRSVAALASVLPLGAGFLPVLFRTDRRAFHDRLAETRVVSA